MIDIDKLYKIALENAHLTSEYKKRFFCGEIESLLGMVGRKNILLSGLRGIGKTTAMLQLFRENKDSFYFSADSILVRSETLFSIVEELYRNGYSTIFIDEIHKYPKWVDELKNIFDSFNVTVVASGSSTAAIKKGGIVLGRRAILFDAKPMSLGEFVYLSTGNRYVATLEDALDKKKAIEWVALHHDTERYYREYLKHGGFPINIEESIKQKSIYQLVRKMIYEDALAEFSLTENKVDVAERMLGFLALSKPGEFSYTSFSQLSGYSKSTIHEVASMLKELGLIRVIEEETPKGKAKGSIKLLFSHPNLRVAFAEQIMTAPEEGALREEYFLFHAEGSGLHTSLPNKMKKTPDYLVSLKGKKVLFEIGGENKTRKQLMGQEGIILSGTSLLCLGFVQKTDQK